MSARDDRAICPQNKLLNRIPLRPLFICLLSKVHREVPFILGFIDAESEWFMVLVRPN
jgi:hypothetical protein